MGARLIFILCLSTLVSCTPLSSNFKVTTDVKEVTFTCRSNSDGQNAALFDTYLDTMINFHVINSGKKDVIFFHDKTFITPFYKPLTPFPSNENQIVIKYFGENKDEILGRFSTVYIDSSFVGLEYFSSEIIDTATYLLKANDTLSILQRINLPYNKNGLLITLNENDCKKVHLIQFCLSKGKKGGNGFYGFCCSDFINVVHR